ncbi:hypothetical protein IB230_19510 [Pseudoxanthomonas sp. PXM01]|nr:hypothetical protein [Pseudoxanthomonas sp. PXM01]
MLIEVDDWKLGQPLDAQIIDRLAQAREALCFGALSRRRLFCPNSVYCNSDNFRLVIAPLSRSVAYSARRRDGYSLNGWGEGEFSFSCPLHVHKEVIEVEAKLVKLIMSSPSTRWLDSVLEFNLANTDSQDAGLHAEMVMMKSAFERLLKINVTVDAFSDALELHLRPLLAQQPDDGDMRKRWDEIRPRSPTLMDAWARDFCAARGSAAHGGKRSAVPLGWSLAAHLAYASVLFPLLLKVLAHGEREYTLTDNDIRRVHFLEHYLAYQPFFPTTSIRQSHDHPWFRIEQAIQS